MSDIEIKGKVTGTEELSKTFNRAPEKYRRAIFAWLLRESASFVGNSKRDGRFRKKLMSKNKSGGGKWSRKIIKLFKGEVTGTEKISGMKLTMGLIYHNKKLIHEIVENMSIDQTMSPKKGKFLILPINKNLRNLPNNKKALGIFSRKIRDKSLTMIKDEKNLLYFDKKSNKQLLFIGIKKANIKRQYDIEGDWGKVLPSAYNRFMKTIDRTTQKLNKR